MTERISRTESVMHAGRTRTVITRACASVSGAALCCAALLVTPASTPSQTVVRERRVGDAATSTSTRGTKKPTKRNRRRNTAKTRAAKENAAKLSPKNTNDSSGSPAAQSSPTAPDTNASEVTVPESAPLEAAEAPAVDDLDSVRAARDAAKSDAERTRLDRLYIDRLVTESTPEYALGELRSMLADERFDPPLYYNIGNALARLGDTGTAVTAYRKAIDQRKGDYPRALNNLGVVLLKTGDAAEAETVFLDALRRENSVYPEASYNLGRLYNSRGEADLARRHLRRAVRYDPNHVPAVLLLAELLSADGDREEAIKILDGVRSTDEEERRRVSTTRAAINNARGTNDDRGTERGSTAGIKSKISAPLRKLF